MRAAAVLIALALALLGTGFIVRRSQPDVAAACLGLAALLIALFVSVFYGWI